MGSSGRRHSTRKLVSSLFLKTKQHDVRTHTGHQGTSIRENADSPNARPTLRAALHARQHRSLQPLKCGVRD